MTLLWFKILCSCKKHIISLCCIFLWVKGNWLYDMRVSVCSEWICSWFWNFYLKWFDIFRKFVAWTFMEVQKSCMQSYENWNRCMKSSDYMLSCVLFVCHRVCIRVFVIWWTTPAFERLRIDKMELFILVSSLWFKHVRDVVLYFGTYSCTTVREIVQIL
jgi:hypothetical protein